LLDEKDLTNMLRQERMLELQYQLKLEQLSAWRMAKQGGTAGFLSTRRASNHTFRVSPGHSSVARPYLLISQGLMAELLKRKGEGSLNLKDLLAMLPRRFGDHLRGSVENEPVLRRLFRAESHQILPFSGKNMQIMAENGGLSAPILGERAG